MNLEAVKNIPGLKPISAPHERAGFPTIALPVAFLTGDGDEHAVTVMPLAKGAELCDFIDAHKKLQTESDQGAVKQAYYALGQEGANFRREFGLVHRDMKCANIFVDKKHATLIDNETMAPSSDEPDYNQYQDMRKVLFGNYLKNESREMRHILDGANLSAWYEASFKSYVQGWVDTYPPAKQHQALSEIREALSPPWEGLSVDYDQEKLDEVRAKYLIPILNKVGSTLPK
jgi:serine/threonine protein kinase